MMRILSVLLCCTLGVALLLGCSGGGDKRPGAPVAVLREYKGTKGPFADRGFMVVQRAEVWAALWAGRETPAVDFAKETVLVALMGKQLTGGFDITIDEVRATATLATGYVTERKPAPDADVPQVITYPYHMAIVAKTALPVQMLIAGKGVVQPVTIQNAYEGVAGAMEDPETFLVRDREAWRTLAAAVGLVPAPEIDFAKYQVAAIALGEQPTGGFSVRITGVLREDDRWVVQYRTTEPLPDTPTPPGPTSPWALAVLPKEDVPVAFRNVVPVVPTAPK